jgi:hypothetical protein
MQRGGGGGGGGVSGVPSLGIYVRKQAQMTAGDLEKLRGDEHFIILGAFRPRGCETFSVFCVSGVLCVEQDVRPMAG